mmetsp:Transcript_154742/g.475408  ORF Transcript_154742/g.475408 Transcript_154742/m.475408 type:complete len:301 (-) Transcript_154742:132-1034(-)
MPVASPTKSSAAVSPSTKASTGANSEPATPLKESPVPELPQGSPEAAAPETSKVTAAASPRSVGSTRANTAANSTPLATPRGGSVRKSSPGPVGHSVLNLSTYTASPRYTFQPPHRDLSALKVPGPGSYETPTPRGAGLTASLASGRRAVKPHDEVPGPGTHETETAMGKGVKYSIGRPLPSRPSDVPGPGKYEAGAGVGGGPKYSVGLPRSGGKHDVPGPGTYDHEGYTKITQNPQYSVPCSPRQRNIRVEDIPGPGAHAKKTHVGEGPKFSHGLPRKEKVRTTPGPGDYGGLYTTFHM